MGSGPGRSERHGLSLAEWFAKFADDETSGGAVRAAALARRGAPSRLRVGKRAAAPDPQAAALPLPNRVLTTSRSGLAP